MNTWGVTLEAVSSRWLPQGPLILAEVDLSLTVPTSEGLMMPLMGPSGQGKSTLLYLLAALKWPSSGQIHWHFPNGDHFSWGLRPLNAATGQRLRRDYFGFAFQNNTLFPYLTVIENIAYPLLLQGVAWSKAQTQAEHVLQEELLAAERTEDDFSLCQRFPNQLSGGQRQRVALAQAMIHNPYVLFADEPTGQLDLHTRKQVMQVLKNWVRQGQGQRCFIWVTHHHVDDLDLMAIEHFIFVDQQRCQKHNRQDLARWMKTLMTEF